ncbi:flagellar biosynthesis protein FlgL [Croceicoccus sp. F390]|uniref:Flagellar biosynthesis protein FlgL n=1 Tax=Croceicoccus esteveae TaxID=3075597 RepID=A0ABU2ZH07_9SPHN|nr:flagellar biosynthesis protein FlgL [Croceicoccus sp. F390]MDT0574697.1 flagellar biosynthesis protein FlgL [Croceicoccus sp. F390]
MISTGIGTAAFYTRSLREMTDLRRSTEALQTQLVTGERLARSSDDPVAASRLRTLDRADRLAQIDAANARRASSDLSLAASALQNLADDFTRARELATWAANDPLAPEQREIIGRELLSMVSSMVATANATDSSGNALFGGTATGPAYILDGAGNASYAGTPQNETLALGDGQSVARGITGPQFAEFEHAGVATDIFVHVKILGDALQGGAGGDIARAALAGFDEGMESLTRAQTLTGTRLAWIETVEARQVITSESRASEAAETGGVDPAAAVVRLKALLVVLEASQIGFARVGETSLFNIIR